MFCKSIKPNKTVKIENADLDQRLKVVLMFKLVKKGHINCAFSIFKVYSKFNLDLFQNHLLHFESFSIIGYSNSVNRFLFY